MDFFFTSSFVFLFSHSLTFYIVFLLALQLTETPLHIAVRLDLYHLTLFYLHQSGGQEMATLPNEEQHTPTELAQSRGHTAIINALDK